MRAVNWEWYLGNTSDLSFIGGLQNASQRQISLALNSRESASFSISLREKIQSKIEEINTSLLAFRNDDLVWSGPVMTTNRDTDNGTLQVGCVGWFDLVNHWLLHTGTVAPLDMPSSTATSQQYVNFDQCSVAADLITRGIKDTVEVHGAPLFVGLGQVPSNTQSRTITYQQYKSIGQAIVELSQMEAGFDFRVDSKTRLLDMFYNPIWPLDGPATVNGRGQYRPNLVFGHRWGPANVQKVNQTGDGSKVQNESFAVGQFGVGTANDAGSQAKYGIFSVQSSLSDVVNPTILEAYAAAEVATNSAPIMIYSFDLMPLAVRRRIDGSTSFSVPQPFVDFNIGDFGRLKSDYLIEIPKAGSGLDLQPVRLFAFDVTITDEGAEQCKNFQTFYQQVS